MKRSAARAIGPLGVEPSCNLQRIRVDLRYSVKGAVHLVDPRDIGGDQVYTCIGPTLESLRNVFDRDVCQSRESILLLV